VETRKVQRATCNVQRATCNLTPHLPELPPTSDIRGDPRKMRMATCGAGPTLMVSARGSSFWNFNINNRQLRGPSRRENNKRQWRVFGRNGLGKMSAVAAIFICGQEMDDPVIPYGLLFPFPGPHILQIIYFHCTWTSISQEQRRSGSGPQRFPHSFNYQP